MSCREHRLPRTSLTYRTVKQQWGCDCDYPETVCDVKQARVAPNITVLMFSLYAMLHNVGQPLTIIEQAAIRSHALITPSLELQNHYGIILCYCGRFLSFVIIWCPQLYFLCCILNLCCPNWNPDSCTLGFTLNFNNLRHDTICRERGNNNWP